VALPRLSARTEIKVLTAGAFKQVALALVREFERSTGCRVAVDNGTVGELIGRVGKGEAFDVLVLDRPGIAALTKSGVIAAGSDTSVGKVGVGVMVKAGAPRPDVSSVEAFTEALLRAMTVGYIDPASGGSSGIYVHGLLKRLGIAERIAPKARLKRGGHVSELVVSGEAEIGIHQISAIVSDPGVTMVGPLPDAIQNYTAYAAGVAAESRNAVTATSFVRMLSGPSALAVLKSKGMEGP
jgi:molybdate transport system substrate-binding protein